MAQVENEYGSYGSDKDYVKKHLDVIRKELPGVVPFTSDGPNDWMIKNGTLPGVVPAMNFGGGAKGAFANLEKHKGKTPRINGEFWVGWFDHWGKPKNGGSTEGFNRDLKWMLENNVSPTSSWRMGDLLRLHERGELGRRLYAGCNQLRLRLSHFRKRNP